LLHYGAINERKPSKKLHVAFDLRVQSINPVLMQEPYLVDNLVGVLLGFRKNQHQLH